MSSICIIPVKEYSERIPRKNFQLIKSKAGVTMPLYKAFTITLVDSLAFDKVVVDTDSKEIKDWCYQNQIVCIDREPGLAADSANGNSLLRHHVRLFPEHTYYWQAFVTSPYISIETVRKMANTLHDPGNPWDSIMTVEEVKGAFWDQMGQPINHRPELMLRSQDLRPIFKEVCGLFGVMKKAFEASQTRFGLRPRLWVLPPEECVDIDWAEDLEKVK